MSNLNEMRINLPAGWRWVEEGEVRGDAEWRCIICGAWEKSTQTDALSRAERKKAYITPIAPAEPETVDVPVEGCGCRIALIRDPNDNGTFALGYASNITGPTWAFAGYVWPNSNPESGLSNHYYMVYSNRVEYATAVRFRKVKGGAE